MNEPKLRPTAAALALISARSASVLRNLFTTPRLRVSLPLRLPVFALWLLPDFAFDPVNVNARGVISKASYGCAATTSEKIAVLNDLCRKAMGVAGRVVQTSGIVALTLEDQSAIRAKVETFDTFTPDNDPYGERDFGAFDHKGQRIFWKIDYYDTTSSKGSEDPSDLKQTVRVLTIMLASEY